MPHALLTPPRILMLSLHGYVGAEPELGLPDTGGQVVFVLELAKRYGARQSAQFVNGILDRFLAMAPDNEGPPS